MSMYHIAAAPYAAHSQDHYCWDCGLGPQFPRKNENQKPKCINLQRFESWACLGFGSSFLGPQDRTDAKEPLKRPMYFGFEKSALLWAGVVGCKIYRFKDDFGFGCKSCSALQQLPLATKLGKRPRYNREMSMRLRVISLGNPIFP